MKKENFSLGINLADGILSNQQLVLKYKDYIGSIYIGPSLDLLSHDFTALEPYTEVLQSKYTDINIYQKDLLTICDIARSNDIKICLTVNNNKSTIEGLNQIKDFLDILVPEQICTTKKFLPWFKDNCDCDFYIQTFFEGGPHKEDVENHMWESYVIKHKHILNSLVTTAENRLLINQACPNICNGCYTNGHFPHQKLIDKEFTTPEEYFANHLWGREDIIKFKDLFPNIKYCFKVSSRIRSLHNDADDDLLRVDKYLDALINGSIKDLMNKELKNLACVYVGMFKNSRTGEKLGSQYDFEGFNWDKFFEYKAAWWNSIQPNIFN